MRNTLNSTIDKAKCIYTDNNLLLNSKNPKKFWRIINELIKPNTSSDVSSIDFKDPMSGLVIPRNDVPDFINIYFANIAQNTSDPTKVKLPTLQKHNFDFLLQIIPDKFLLLYAN